MKVIASMYLFDGRDTPQNMIVLDKCHAWYNTTTSLIFTRDIGYHSGGWWKNPDYERCYHLSLSFCAPNGERQPKSERLTKEWVELFYQDHVNLVWAEPPYFEVGKKDDTWHYRLFCDEHWQPILPRGEVYSTQFTERGWKSWSELIFEKGY